MLLCGFESRLGLESSGCSMWHFLKLVARGFLRVLRFPPLLHRYNGSANKIIQINAISTLSNLIVELSLRTKWHVTWHLHVISARCVARDLHTIAPGPLERTCWRQFAALWGDCKKSRITPLNAIIIIKAHSMTRGFYRPRTLQKKKRHRFWLHSPKTLSDESIYRGLVYARMYSILRTQQILTFMSSTGEMPATKTHPARTVHEDGTWLPKWLDWKTVIYTKISPKMVGP